MNWGAATVVFVIAEILEQIIVEFVRSMVDRRRRDRDGVGGTQDIAICRMLIGWLLVVGALLCGTAWLLNV